MFIPDSLNHGEALGRRHQATGVKSLTWAREAADSKPNTTGIGDTRGAEKWCFLVVNAHHTSPKLT